MIFEDEMKLELNAELLRKKQIKSPKTKTFFFLILTKSPTIKIFKICKLINVFT
jgi:hypothetical protein